jgi:nicotinamidase-related amidase
VNAQAADGSATAHGALADWIAPARTAVIIVDMQVDFAAPDGLLGLEGVDLSLVQPALAAAQRLVAAARSARAPVVFVGLRTEPGSDSSVWRERLLRRGAGPEAENALCRAGGRGAEFWGPAPQADEPVVLKTRYSGFFGTDLDARLAALGVDTLIVGGLTTECCVDCTVRDAFHLDYHVFVASDACAAYEPDLHLGALKSLDLNCAILVSTDQVLAAWGERAAHG